MRRDSLSLIALRQGFTLLEVLVVIALLGVIVGIGMPLYRNFQVRNDLDVAVLSIVHAARRAQSLAQAVDGDAQWGFALQAGQVVLFKGSNFAARDASYDEATALAASIAVSGTTEVVFSKVFGFPQPTSGSLALTTLTNESRTITFNEKGSVSY